MVESVKCVSVMIIRSILLSFMIFVSCFTLAGCLRFSTLKYAITIGVEYGICIGWILLLVIESVWSVVISFLNLAALVM